MIKPYTETLILLEIGADLKDFKKQKRLPCILFVNNFCDFLLSNSFAA